MFTLIPGTCLLLNFSSTPHLRPRMSPFCLAPRTVPRHRRRPANTCRVTTVSLPELHEQHSSKTVASRGPSQRGKRDSAQPHHDRPCFSRQNSTAYIFFFFQLHLTFNIILYSCPASSIAVRHSYNSQSAPPISLNWVNFKDGIGFIERAASHLEGRSSAQP